MMGAGGLIGVNHVYKGAKPDGLTIGTHAFSKGSVEHQRRVLHNSRYLAAVNHNS